MTRNEPTPRTKAASQISNILVGRNEPPSDHTIATLALSMLAVSDAIVQASEVIARSNREVADAIRQAGRWNAG